MMKALIFLTSFLFLYHGMTTAQITNGCSTSNKACYYFSTCAETSSPANGNIATIYTAGDNSVQFELQYDNAAIGWIAIGISDNQLMPQTWIFMCQRADNAGVDIEERFASANSRPPVTTSILTAVAYANSGSVLNCTFTSPVTRTPMLNNAGGYWILLARGSINNGIIQNHGMSNRCVSPTRPVITTAVGSGSTNIVPAMSLFYAMFALLFASYLYL